MCIKHQASINMRTSENSASITLYAGGVIFLLMALASIIIFASYALPFIKELIAKESSIILNKGSFILPGIAIGSAALSYVFFLEAITKQASPKQAVKLFTRTVIVGFVLIFLLPQIVHHPTENYLKKIGYSICDKASYQWLHARTIVYTNAPDVCIQKTAEKIAGSR